MDITYTVLVAVFAMPNASVVSESHVLWLSISCKSSLCVIRIGLLIFPTLFPQQTVCTANMHMLPLVGTGLFQYFTQGGGGGGTHPKAGRIDEFGQHVLYSL